VHDADFPVGEIQNKDLLTELNALKYRYYNRSIILLVFRLVYFSVQQYDVLILVSGTPSAPAAATQPHRIVNEDARVSLPRERDAVCSDRVLQI